MSARGAMITVLATELSEAVRADDADEGHDIGAGMFGLAVSAWIRKTVDAFIDASATPRDPKSLLDRFDNAAAFTQFEQYIVKNYPPDCVIARPEWHAPKLWRQALYALTMNPKIDAEAVSPKFTNVSCSQCGRDFGPGDHGYSHCFNHTQEAKS